MYQGLDRIVGGIAAALALAGGAVLLALVALTCVSILGRALLPLGLGFGSVRGIYDMTEMGVAAAIFAFLPWTHYTEAHAKVDLLRPLMPGAMDRGLALVFDFAMLVVAVVGTWRLWLGMTDKMRYGETTLIAQIPVWWGYAAGLAGAIGFVLVAAFSILRSARRLAGVEA